MRAPIQSLIRTGPLCAALLLAVIGLTPRAHAKGAAQLWVAPGGSDSAPGTRERPFATLERARDAARALRGRAVFINLKDGTYRLTRPFELDARDGGRQVVYRAAPGATPVISGAVAVRGWQPYAGRIQRAYVGAVVSRQLYVNGRRAMRARTQDFPASFRPAYGLDAGGARGIEYLPNPVLNPAHYADPALWSEPSQVEAVVVTQWKMASCPVDHIEPPMGLTPGLLVMQEPCWTNANMFRDENSGLPGIWSFWQVTRFENALQFLDEAGEWYLDRASGYLYYWPFFKEDLSAAAVELPVLETLVDIRGTATQPVTKLRFSGLTFTGATWTEPSGPDGYVADQGGFHLIGTDHTPNYTGHDNLNWTRTPGNISVRFGTDLQFDRNTFANLGAVGLDFVVGGQRNRVTSNIFRDISSAAVQIGGVGLDDARPPAANFIARDNTLSNNHIYRAGRDYVDAAGVMIGYAQRTSILHNTIIDVPWSGVSIGWGWGLLDSPSFPGLGAAIAGMWGNFDTPTVLRETKVVANRIENYVNVVWDGGAVYTVGGQGPTPATGTLLAGNVAAHKRPRAGSNTFYTDGGSTHVTLRGNVSYDNPTGFADFGPCPSLLDPLPVPPYCIANIIPYGSDSGGCRTYGNIRYIGNYWAHPRFEAPCPYTDDNGVSYPINLTYSRNRVITGEADVPQSILRHAGSNLLPR
jgi:hypothetical protein